MNIKRICNENSTKRSTAHWYEIILIYIISFTVAYVFYPVDKIHFKVFHISGISKRIPLINILLGILILRV